jgi:hypothetical protein
VPTTHYDLTGSDTPAGFAVDLEITVSGPRVRLTIPGGRSVLLAPGDAEALAATLVAVANGEMAVRS